MTLQTVARRDDSILLTDPDQGPGAILINGEDAQILHRESVLGTGYWKPSNEPIPTLHSGLVQQLREFNERWMAKQAGFRERTGSTASAD